LKPVRRTARGVWALVTGVVLATVVELTPAAAYGGDDDGDRARCLAVIARANADLSSFTARVRQTKKLALLEQPLESTGRLTFKRPNRIAWRIEEPTALRVIIDGDRLSIPGIATDDAIPAAIGPSALLRRLGAVFTGNIEALTDAFDVTASCHENSADVMLSALTPELEISVSSLALELAGPELFVQSIRMTNGVGDSLELRLHDVERNATIPDTAFSTDDASP
jgi:outer membrane lipoprotein-sorting protein